RLHEVQRVFCDQGGSQVDMHWVGEYLWRADVTPTGAFQVCAKDRAGNQACAGPGGNNGDSTAGHDDVIPPGGNGGGCCDATRAPGGSWLLALGVLLISA